MEVHTALAHELARHGADTMFGVTGEGNVFLADRFARDERGRYVAAASETGAVVMAKGYAAVSGRLGVATVTHGPGLTNAMTALVDGVRESAPIVLVAGDTAAEDTGNLQNIDQRQVVLASGAGFEQVRAPSTVSQDVAAACRRALIERRPIVLNVPADFMFRECELDEQLTVAEPSPATGPDPGAVDKAVGVIAAARRPIVLAGRGATAPAARSALLALAEKIGAPLATTLMGKDLFRGEEFDLGIFGALSHPVAAEAIRQSDCIVAFGASLNGWTTGRGAYLEGKRVVQCDVDQCRLGARARIDAGVAGDAAVTARALISLLIEASLPPTGFRSGHLRARLSELTGNAGEHAADAAGPVGLGEFLDALDGAVPSDRIVVLDSGRFVFQAFTRLHVEEPAWFVPTVGFGSIGLGMGHAVGAACAGTDRPVLLIAGDGGFMLGGLAEFNTAVRYGLDVIVAICNDGSYGAEEGFLRARGMDAGIARFRWPEFAALAAALGGTGISVDGREDLHRLPTAIAARRGPLLIEIRLDPATVPGFEH